MQVAYRSSVVRSLGPGAHTLRSNSTSAPKKGLSKATSWGGIALPGRGESVNANVKDSISKPKLATTGSPLLSERLKQWTRSSKEVQPATGTEIANSLVSTPKKIFPDLEDLSDATRFPEIPEDAQSEDMTAWNTAVRKLHHRKGNYPVINPDLLSGSNWTPGQPVPRRNQESRAQHNPGKRLEQHQAQGNVSQTQHLRHPRQRDSNTPNVNNRGRQGTERASSKPRRPPPSIRKAMQVVEKEREEDETEVHVGEEGLFAPKLGQSQEEWLTEFLVTDPDPEAPGRADPDVHVAFNADSMFATGSPLSAGITPTHLVNLSKATPTQILRRHGGEYSHFLPPKVQGTGIKNLSVMAHANLVMAKRRDMHPSRKAKVSFIVKHTTQPRRVARA
ncbi:hypothetical protein L218DRAFT_1072042 [Marasmius fiardii PR-910]|nr:hypothetical protein L218DRAFT_1072042 [Marasmius fiardii PR-910]